MTAQAQPITTIKRLLVVAVTVFVSLSIALIASTAAQASDSSQDNPHLACTHTGQTLHTACPTSRP